MTIYYNYPECRIVVNETGFTVDAIYYSWLYAKKIKIGHVAKISRDTNNLMIEIYNDENINKNNKTKYKMTINMSKDYITCDMQIIKNKWYSCYRTKIINKRINKHFRTIDYKTLARTLYNIKEMNLRLISDDKSFWK